MVELDITLSRLNRYFYSYENEYFDHIARFLSMIKFTAKGWMVAKSDGYILEGSKMNSAMIAFFFGVVVGGLGGTLLIGLLFLNREHEKKVKDIQKIGDGLHGPSIVKLKMGRALQALWGTLR
jgi:hypothetical protein